MNSNPGTNPFKGLYYYEEEDKDIFFGRTGESVELCNLVELNRLTVVFGKSGIGKTSLLNAGVFPLLRGKSFLPVRIRLDYSKDGLPLLKQVNQAIQRELIAHGILEMKKGEDVPADSIGDDETLWEYFRRVDHLNKEFSGGVVTPVMVFDQFEEFFTIGKHHPQRELLVEELYWLVEDQAPPALKQRILANQETFPYLLDYSAFRLVLGLREDYLPHLNGLKQRIPSLLKVLLRVIHLNGFQAREVLDRSKAFTDEIIKKDILDQFYPADIEPRKITDEKLEVEPALFSLLCYQVYEKGVGSLTRQTRDDILSGFYDQILGQLPRSRELAEWIENHLLTEGGFRTPFYLERGHGMREVIEAAIDKKLLRKLYVGEKEHVEIIHDVLASVINEKRNRRIEEKKRKRIIKIAGIISMVAILAISLAIFAFIQKNRADKQKNIATQNEQKTLAQKNRADRKAQEALNEKNNAKKSEQKALAEKKRADVLYKEAIKQKTIAEAQTQEAIKQRNRAEEQYKMATSLRLASEAELIIQEDKYKAIRVAEAAYRIGRPSPPVAATRVLCSAAYSTKDRPFYKIFLNHDCKVRTVVFSPDSSLILTTSLDSTAKLWKMKENLIVELKGHTNAVNSAVFSHDGSRILTASDDKTAKLWNIKGNLIVELKGHTNAVNSAVFSLDGSLILTASNDNTAKLWDIHGKLLADLNRHTLWINSAVFSPDGTQILTASWDQTAKLWDLNGKLLFDMKKHDDKVISAVFSPDGKRILTASWDRNANLWDYNEQKSQWESQWDKNKGIYIYPKSYMHADKLTSALFSPDGSMILTASHDRKAKLWDVNQNLMATLKGHIGTVYRAVFSADGSRILTASHDKTAKLWNIHGELLANLEGHTDPVNSAAFSPDGKWIVTASDDGKAIIWLPPEGILEYLKTAPIPKLTEQEKKELGIDGFDLD